MRHICIAILFFSLVKGLPQASVSGGLDYRMESFRLPDGPSGNSINSVTQGPNGFLWFGGHAGLYRYDGYRFKSYKSSDEDPDALVFSYIEFLFWSSDEYLWIGTYGGGLFRFDPIDESFIRFQYDPDDLTSLSNNYVTHILEENDTVLWVGTVGGLNRLDRRVGKFERFLHNPDDPSTLSNNDVRSLYLDKENNLWIGTGFIYNDSLSLGGLNKFDPSNRSFTRYLHKPEDTTSLAGNIVKSIYEDSQGDFWVGSSGGLQKMDRNKGVFKRIQYEGHINNSPLGEIIRANEPTVVYAILEDNRKNLLVFTLHNSWANPLGSIVRIDLSTNQTEVLENRKPFVPWQVEQSRDGSFWIAGAGVGGEVNKIIPGNPLTKNLPFAGGENLSIEGLVRANDSVVWGKTTTENAVQLIGFQDDFNTYGIRTLPEIKTEFKSLWGGPGYDLVINSAGRIFGCTGNRNGGLFIIHPQTAEAIQFLHDPYNPNTPPTNIITNLMFDRSGKLWMSGENAVSRWDLDTGAYIHFLHDSNDYSSLPAGYYYNLFEDQDGKIWVSGNRVNDPPWLARISPDTGLVERIEFGPEYGSTDIISITQHSNGDLLVLLHGIGVRRFSKEQLSGELWNRKYTGEALIGNAFVDANNLIRDDQGFFWLTNREGKIFRFDGEFSSTVEINDHFGLQPLQKGAFKLDDGSIYFAYAGGLISVNPTAHTNRTKSASTKVGFTEFRLNGLKESQSGEGILERPVWKEELIKLSHEQRNLSFRFSAFDFKDPANSRYEVRLLPYETEWQRLEGDPMVNYFQLPPGNYTLEVRGSDSNGVWAEEPSQMRIIIAPPWWRTWWAYTIYFILLVFLGYRFHLYQKSKTIEKAQKQAREKELEQAREIQRAYEKLKATQSQLIHSEKMASLGELTAGIAHEIQNPLNFVNNFSEVNRELIEELKEESGKKTKERNAELEQDLLEDIDQNLEKISHHGKRADSIVKGMLQHSRSSDGKKEPTDLNNLADEYLRLAYHGLRAKDKSFNAQMETDFDTSIGKVNVVPQDIGRVLLNLLTNAFHAVSERQQKQPEGYDPTVWVKTQKTKAGIQIKVQDNGGGIPEEIRDKIFQPFFTTKPTGEGTGLGLSMSYDIVTKGHGGQLTMKSSTGEGTEFLITLPV